MKQLQKTKEELHLEKEKHLCKPKSRTASSI
jgi:hypothetical protein